MVRHFSALLACGIAAAILYSTGFAHVDDPKERDRQPPYIGPGYFSGQGGIAGGPEIDFPANGVQLLAWLPVNLFNPGNTSASTVEGYVSPSGREYAIVGLSDGTGFVEVTDAGMPDILAFIPGPDSLWKDVRVYQHYAYSVSEGGQGIQVMDMSQIDNGVVTLVGATNTPTGTTAATHTMFINPDTGHLFRSGGGGNGLRIYSLANPASPAYLGAWPDRYVHEVTVVNYTEGPYAGKEIAFCCGGFNNGNVNSGLYIVDITNLLDGNPDNGNPMMSFFPYPGATYAHQGWLSEDKHYFYLDDELDEPEVTSLTRIIDVQNLTAPSLAGTFTSGAPSVDHNLYVKGNTIFESNYRSGLRIFDATNPTAPVQTAFFDTYPADDNANFNSLWDNYPYLPSGIVLGSDIEKGLFIWSLGPAMLDFSYPKGQPDLINPAGDTVAVNIANQAGELDPDTALLHYNTGAGFQTAPLQPVGGSLYHAVFPAIPCGTQVRWYISAQTTTGVTLRDPAGAPTSHYTATAALDIAVGVEDTLETNTGWVAGIPGDNATSGLWTRVDPNGTGAAPEDDHTLAPGVMCFVTGQGAPGAAVGTADIDGGTTTLVSATFDATGGADPYVAYARWYSNDQGSAPNQDTMPIEISNNNGTTWTQLELVSENAGAWVVKTFPIADFVTPSNQMKVRFIARDLLPASVVEAGVDDLQVVYYNCGNGPGDVNGDGIVNVNDLLAVVGAWGDCPPPCPADLNGDGVVNVNDLLEVVGNWG